jgi:hypothetical protein
MTGRALFVASCPVPGLPQIILSERRWLTHIVTQHTDMRGREGQVEAVITGATAALTGSNTSGTANPNYVILINDRIVSASGSPLCVVLDRQTAMVRTAYFNRSLRIVDKGRLLWRR